MKRIYRLTKERNINNNPNTFSNLYLVSCLAKIGNCSKDSENYKYKNNTMHHLPEISGLFTPLQPTTQKNIDGISYGMVKPHAHLQKYIYSYWEFYTEKPLEQPYYHRVVADGCIALIIDLLNPENSFFRGFVTHFTEYKFEGVFHYIGVCFYPSAFPVLFNCPAKELTNQFEQLDSLMPRMAKSFAELFDYIMPLYEVEAIFNNYFLTIMMQKLHSCDGRFLNAIDLILKSGGLLQVQSDLNTGISPRQMRRLFDFYIGEAPKKFCSIVRFQNFINAKPTVSCIRQRKIYYDVGYYDQAHFIKEFKHLYGLTPSIAFQ